MTMDVSRLGIEVQSKGIDEARKALDGGNGRGGLFGAAERAEKSVTKLTDSLSKMLNVNASGTATAWGQSLGALGATLSVLNTNINATTRALQGLAPAMQNAGTATQQAAAANERVARTGNVVMNTLKAMTTAAVAYNAVNLGLSVLKQADSWQMMESRLQNATGSMNNARAAQQQMFELAQRLRVPLEDSVKLFTRLAPSIQAAGKSSAYAKDMVEGIATALQLGGANGAEASSVMLQLSQSFSSGVLNGAEFNAVAENGSVLMKALRDSTGKSNAELKKMGSEGKLTMDMLGKAIEQSLPKWREEFDRLPLTFEGAMQRLKNAWTRAVGEMGQDTGFNKRLAESLSVIEKMIPAVAQGLGNAFISVMTWIDKNREMLGQIVDQIGGLIKDVLKLGASIASLSGDVVAVGDDISLWGLAIYMVRGTLAAIVDIVKVVGSAFAHAGLDIATFFVFPIFKALEAVEFLLNAFKDLTQFAANAMRAIGKFEAADTLQARADSIGEIGNKVGGWAKSIDGFFTSARKSVNGWTEDLREGNGELDKFLRGDDLTKAMAAREKLRMDEEAWQRNNPAKTGAKDDPKAIKAEETRLKKFQEAYATLVDQIEVQRELAANLAKSGLDYDKITPAQKELIKFQREYNALVLAGADKKKQDAAYILMIQAQEAAALSTQNERTKEQLTAIKAVESAHQTELNTLRDQAEAFERQAESYGKAKGAVEELALAQARARLSDMMLTSDGQRDASFEKRLAALREEVGLRERIATAKGSIGESEAAKAFDKLFDERKAEKFGNVLAEGFGKAGKALGTLVNAMEKYQSRQAKITQGRKELDKLDKTGVEYATRKTKLEEESAEAQMASYADIAGAAKNFFNEQSEGYKLMEAAEKTFRAAQMAMAISNAAVEMGLIEATTAARIKGYVMSAIESVKSTAIQIANGLGLGSVLAALGVATQAQGDPYTAWGRMAAMAATMAALGFAVSGGRGSGGSSAKQRQEAQGTGTVFGDEKAKSESIMNSLAMLSKNSDIALRYSSGMLSSLQNIEYSLTGATSGVIRSGSVTGKGFENSSSMFGGAGGLLGATVLTGVIAPILAIGSKLPLIGNLVGKIASGLFGSKSSLVDAGLMGNSQSVGNILSSGFNVKGYQDIQTKKKLFGVTYSDKTKTETSAVDPAISNEFGNIISSMVDSLVFAASALGQSGDLVRQKLEAVNIDIGKISLKDLSSEEIQKQLEAVFSAIGDKLSNIALPMVAAFQKPGEGLLETAVRVASGVEAANYELEKLGVTAISFQQLANKSGDVASEIVRQSLLMQTSSAGIRDIISTMSGDAGTIADTYRSLTNVRTSLIALRVADDVSRDLIKAAGGLDALQSALDAYQSNFFTDQEQLTMKTSALRAEFQKLGLNMPATKADFRAMVESLSQGGESGQALATKVILLAGAFADLTEGVDENASAIQAARDELTEAYNREADALTSTKEKFQELADSLKNFKTNLLTGELSPLNVAQKYDVEKKRFDEILAKAKAGDEGALNSFEGVASAFLNASRGMFASGSQYTSDFQRVLDETEFLEGLASGKASLAEQQLQALNKQVEGLLTVNESVLTVAQAITNLTALLAGTPNLATPPTVKIPTEPPAVQAAGAISDVAANMVAEVKAMAAELAALRQEQAQQTGDLIASNYDANQQNAAEVVEGAGEVASRGNYLERAQVTLA